MNPITATKRVVFNTEVDDTTLLDEFLSQQEKEIMKILNDNESTEKYYNSYSDGSVYIGDALKHGNGLYVDQQQKTVYNGQYRYGLREGQGNQKYKDGTTYTGGWKQDKFDGFGTVQFTDGSKFEGYFANGVCSNDFFTVNGFNSQLIVTKNDDMSKSGEKDFAQNKHVFNSD